MTEAILWPPRHGIPVNRLFEPFADLAEVLGELTRCVDVRLHPVVRQEGVDQLETPPGPVAQLISILDVGDAEDVVRDVIREAEADLLDDTGLPAAILPAQRVVDDLLRPLDGSNQHSPWSRSSSSWT